MQVSVEKTSELSRTITVTVPETLIQQKIDAKLKQLANTARIDGFRPGKVPAAVLKKIYGPRVRDEVTGELIETSLRDALRDHDIRPVGTAKIEPQTTLTGDFSYAAHVEVYPEITLPDFAALEIKRPVADITEDDFAKVLEQFREQRKTWQAVARPSQMGDRVIIHFNGECEGEAINEKRIENYVVELGKHQVIADFENQLVGLPAGTQHDFSATFPEDYGNPKLAGKTAQFSVEVKSVEESVLPEINSDFVRAYGIESGDVETFYSDVRNNMARLLEQNLRERIKQNVMAALQEHVTFQVPQQLVDEEVQRRLLAMQDMAGKQPLPADLLDGLREQIEPSARKQVGLMLLVTEIIQRHQLTTSDSKIRALLENIAQSYEDPQQVIEWYYKDQRRFAEIYSMALEYEVVDWVAAQARLDDETLHFQDMMQPAAKTA